MARNVGPNKMKHSNVFQTVAPKIHSISQEELLFQLCVASQKCDVNLNSRDIDGAIVWVNSPQGVDFWCDLNNEAAEN